MLKVDFRQLLGNEIQALHRPAIVIFVVADDQPLGFLYSGGIT